MFHAVIRTPTRGPLRISGEVVPYDLQVLREHIIARRGRGTRVEVRLASARVPALLHALRGLDALGVELVLAG